MTWLELKRKLDEYEEWHLRGEVQTSDGDVVDGLDEERGKPRLDASFSVDLDDENVNFEDIEGVGPSTAEKIRDHLKSL